MTPPAPGCPSADDLRALLDRPDAPPAAAGHLEHCPECRRRLETLALGSTAWLLQGVRDQAARPADPAALVECLQALTATGPPAPAGGTAGADTLRALDTLDDPFLDEFLRRPAHERPRLGPYEILSVLGRGGMGLVLQGYHPGLQRPVALKLPSPGLRGHEPARQRFLREARAAAAIDHPHVVPIHAVEEWAGVPVLVMAYIQGESLQARLDRDGPLPVADALRIALGVAEGLAAAHAAGLVHRDIKPANILLQAPHDTPRLTDFGLARAADDPRLTRTGLGAGTPLYMAPEQAEGGPTDPRADLFSLGSVLYTALTGRPPFAADSLLATLRRITDAPPDPVRRHRPDVPRHTETLVMDLLQKDPDRRPATARLVAERLRTCLGLLARGLDPTPRKVRRTSVLVGLLVAGVGTLALAGTVLRFPTPQGTLVVDIEDPQAKVSYDAGGREMTISGVGVQEVKLRLGEHRVRVSGEGGQVREEIVTITRDGKPVVRAALDRTAERDRLPGGPVPADPHNPFLPGGPGRTGPEGVAGGPPGGPGMMDPGAAEAPAAPFGKLVRVLNDLGGPARAVAVIDGGRKLVTGTTWPRPDEVLRVWDVATGRELRRLTGFKGDVPSILVLPDGQTVATGHEDGQIRLWDPAAGKLLRSFPAHPGQLVIGLALSADGKTLATGAADGSVHLIELATGSRLKRFEGHEGRVRSVSFTTDGNGILAGDEAGQVVRWDTASGRKLWETDLKDGWVEGVAAIPGDKDFLALTRTITVGDQATGRPRVTLGARTAGWPNLAFSPDGRRAVTVANGGQARLWDLKSLKEIGRVQVTPGGGNLLGAAFSPDGRTLFVAGGGSFHPLTQDYRPLDLGIYQYEILK